LTSAATVTKKLLDALREHRPDTVEAADFIVNEVIKREVANQREVANVEDDGQINDEVEEAESILDDAPPVLPPPTTPPEPQKLGAHTEWAGRDLFEDAVSNLLGLCTKPIGRFVGIIPPTDLNKVTSWLSAIEAADTKEMPASTEAA
jgi:hypothetical protein